MYIIELYENENGESEMRDYFKKLQSSKNKDNRIKSKKIVERL